MRGLGIEPEVELVPRAGGELGIVGLRIEAAAHEHDALGERGEFGIDGNGERDVGHTARRRRWLLRADARAPGG